MSTEQKRNNGRSSARAYGGSSSRPEHTQRRNSSGKNNLNSSDQNRNNQNRNNQNRNNQNTGNQNKSSQGARDSGRTGVKPGRRTQQKRNNLTVRLVIMIVLAVLVPASVIGGVIKESRKPKQETVAGADGESTNTSESLQGTADEISGADDEVEAAIISLVRQYRAACASGDTAAIAKLYNLTEVKNPHTFMATATIITGYQNTECYIRPGLDDASKVVFIYDDLKLADFDTLVPNLSYVYVRAASDGSFYIYPGEYDESSMSYVYDKDILELIDNLEGDTEIAGLVKTVNEKFARTCESNNTLKAYIDQLSSVSDDQKNNDEPQSTADTDASSETEGESGTSDDTAQESGTPETETSPADNTNV